MTRDPRCEGSWFWLAAGGAFLIACAALLHLSFSFIHGRGHAERPLGAVILLLLGASAAYVALGWRAWRRPPPLGVVVTFALLFRIVLLPSTPIQEDDIYRYLWDGKVVAAGLDPYRFSPEEILSSGRAGPSGAGPAVPGVPARIDPYRRLRDRSAANRTILSRVNNARYVTIYSPCLVALFAAPALWVPDEWPVAWQVTALKAVFVAFDAGVLLALVLLLREAGRPAGLSVLYGWCPLVLKEVSNSGHLDAVPVFFLALSLLLVVRAGRAETGRGRLGRAFLAGIALGAAGAGKPFAWLLVPLLWRRLEARLGAATALAAALVLLLEGLAIPGASGRRAEVLVEFAFWWENNAALFLWLEEALAALTSARLPAGFLGLRWAPAISSVAARGVVAALGTAAALGLAWGTGPATAPRELLRRVFAVLATLFLLGPLGFPWYFLWCLFLLPFVRLRSWLLLPGVLVVYYAGFWYLYQHGRLGFRDETSAREFFDHWVVTAEFAVLYLGLGLELLVLRGELWRRRDAS